MPGTNDPEADALDSILADPGTGSSDGSADGGIPAGEQAVLDALKPSSAHAQGGSGQAAPKAPTNWEERYKGIRPEFDKRTQKLSSLEKLISSQKFQALAQTDPDVAQALGKMGYQLAKEEAQAQGEDGVSPENIDWQNNPDARFSLLEARFELKDELREFAQEALGRRFKPEEEQAVLQIIMRAPSLTAAEAWKLTRHHEQARLSAEQKRMAEAQARAPRGARPRPNPGITGAEQINLKKNVTEYNEAEKREFLRNLPE